MTKRTALITGASSGIGSELARELASRGCNLVLAGRNVEALQKLAGEIATAHGVEAQTVSAELGHPEGAREIVDFLQRQGITIDVLVNNAGLGIGGNFIDNDAARLDETVQVNVAALTSLTRALLPGMVARKQGKVLNVASTAAFQPGPGMAAYYATKAYVLSLSEALSAETKGTGVTVTCLCPGPTQTAFVRRAGVGNTRLFKSGLMPIADAASVARYGVNAMEAGKSVAIPGFMNALTARSAPLTPRFLTLAVARCLQGDRKAKAA